MSESSRAAAGFWRFSLAFYARSGVAETLLGLQDRAGHNVNLMLFGLWAGACEGVRLDASGIAAAKAAIAPLDRAVVLPLRELRRRLKDNPDAAIQALRRRVAALELAAERRVQDRLAASLRGEGAADDRLAAAAANLVLILGIENLAEAATLRQALAGFLGCG